MRYLAILVLSLGIGYYAGMTIAQYGSKKELDAVYETMRVTNIINCHDGIVLTVAAFDIRGGVTEAQFDALWAKCGNL